MIFKGLIIFFMKDQYNCIHLYKKRAKSGAPLERYISYVKDIENKWKSNFIKAFVINPEDPVRPYVWSSFVWRPELNYKTSLNHLNYLKYLADNRDDVIFIGPYKSKRTRGMHLCSKGHEWFIQPIKVLGGETCPKCKINYKESNGAKYITELLAERRIEFIKEVRLDRFGHDSELRLDFLVCNNNHPLFAIEYNGVQHYKPIRRDFFGGYDGYKNRVHLDKVKRMFCWSIGLPIVDIPYNESNEQIKETVFYFLNLFNLSGSNETD